MQASEFKDRYLMGERDFRNVDLHGVDLSSLKLCNSNFQHAHLGHVDFGNTDLSGADLSGARMERANLSYTDLRGADLRGADLRGARVHFTNLHKANLSEAKLDGVEMSTARWAEVVIDYADLLQADLRKIKADLEQVLACVPQEVPALLALLKEGRINGTVYEGECACLVGSIAKLRQCDFLHMADLLPDESRPCERWFYAILPGNTPENNPFAQIAAEWMEAWLGKHQSVEEVRG